MRLSYGLDQFYIVTLNSVPVSMASRSGYQIKQYIDLLVPREESQSSADAFSNSRTNPSARNKSMLSVSRSKKDVASDQQAFFIVK